MLTTGGHIVPLSRQQLLKLSQTSKALADWTTVRDFAAQIYGEGKTAKADIDTYGEYNDEGGTNYYVESLTATDAEGEELDPDLSLPFFQTKSWKESSEYCEDEEFLSRLKELYLTKEERTTFVDFDELPREDSVYDLTAPPLLALPTQEEL